MPRHQRPAELSLHSTKAGTENGIQPGPNSSPINLQGVDLGSFGGGFEHDVASSLTPLPPLPQSPPTSPRIAQRRDQPKSLLSNFKSRITPDDQRQKKEMRQPNQEEDEHRPGTSSMSKIYHLRRNPGSTPELSLVGSNENIHRDTTDAGEKPPLPGPRPQPTPQHSEDSIASSKPKRPFGRTKSIRRDSDSNKSRPRINGTPSDQIPPNTAPLQSDWPGSESRMGSVGTKMGFGDKDRRGKSAERSAASESDEATAAKPDKPRGNSFQARGQKITKGIKSGGNNIFSRLGKIGRSTSHNEKEISDYDYKMKVIDKPLVDQTRITRISKQLSGCRDKTEYWMPSLPWRCIDYLNAHCEEEGLYRVPGSGPRVKHWQRRFDTDLDIDLLSEDVGDPNEIASMLKAWLRELPTEIMPAQLQHDLGLQLEKENSQYRNVGQPASQLLRNALSELPPFNYYLLFAITCHLSLLLTNKEKNKMDLNNLAICVGPCLNMERWLFNYLVGDWRHCWQGCYTEKEYLKAEEAFERGEKYPKDSQSADEKALPSALAASHIDDSRSEAASFQSTTDGRTLSSGSGSISAASKPTSSYTDARSRSRDSERRKAENNPPKTYMPVGAKTFPNGNTGLGAGLELKRPRTADQRPHQSDVSQGALPSISTAFHSKTSSSSSTPKVGHNRSRSDLPTTPVKANATEFTYPVRPTS